MKDQYSKFANISSPLLITGPTGSGKSVLAKKIFEQSNINRSQFLTLHLASVKEELIESELFGHKKGAFTGAVESNSGYLKTVGNGTLFLDEVGELSLAAQKKLLYLLEEKKFTPIGSTVAQEFLGRIIMATNKNLPELVKKGEFRSDLFYRINIFQVELLPISSDRQQLRRSIRFIFEAMKRRYNKPLLFLSKELEEELIANPWHGNYRELKNVLEYAIALCEEESLVRAHLPITHLPIKNDERAMAKSAEGWGENYSEALENFEAWYLQNMLEKYQGRVNFSAQKLGLSKATLIAKAKKYQINTMKMRSDLWEKNHLAIVA
jgi:DNA-binding NtrC family response regulator